MSDVFYTKTVGKAYLIINSMCLEIRPLCDPHYSSLSDQLCNCVELGCPFVVWDMIGGRLTIGPEILRNCILVEK